MAKLQISDHALVRYLERIQDVDLEAIRQAIADEIGPLVAGVTEQNVTRNGMRYLIRSGVLVTIHPAGRGAGDGWRDRRG